MFRQLTVLQHILLSQTSIKCYKTDFNTVKCDEGGIWVNGVSLAGDKMLGSQTYIRCCREPNHTSYSSVFVTFDDIFSILKIVIVQHSSNCGTHIHWGESINLFKV